MKIAFISDIHANLPALEAVYEHALTQNVESIYCLGDLVNQNVWNNEAADFISTHNIQCLNGNHDEGIGNNKTAYPWHACYAVLNIDENKDAIYEEQALQVTFYRLGYDINIVIKAIQNSPLHIYYAMRFLNY